MRLRALRALRALFGASSPRRATPFVPSALGVHRVPLVGRPSVGPTPHASKALSSFASSAAPRPPYPSPPDATRAVVYDRHAPPRDVLAVRTVPVPPPGPGEVTVRFLASPANPADVNSIEGSYPIAPASFPAVGGHEGVGVAYAFGEGVDPTATGLDPARSWVIPNAPGLGTWREWATVPASSLRAVPKTVPLEIAAQMVVNLPTAYRVLRDFVRLRPGRDAVALNAPMSAVGRAAIQMCREMGVATMATLRRGDARDDATWRADADALEALGATLVVPDGGGRRGGGGGGGGGKLLSSPEAMEALAAMEARGLAPFPPVALALNGVGGESSAALAGALTRGGVMVTYGGMSRRPAIVPTGAAIFKDVTARGFWLTRWSEEVERAEAEAEEATREEGGAPAKSLFAGGRGARDAMFAHLAEAATRGTLEMPTERLGFEAFAEAVAGGACGRGGRKTVLWMDE